MIIVDTNVISEMMASEPNENVLKWSYKQASSSLSTTAVCEAEILYGIAILPPGKSRNALSQSMTRVFKGIFDGRIVPFDSEAAEEFARLRSHRRRLGRPLDEPDGQIAAICVVHGATFVTRNTDHFESLGLTLINPWAD